MAANGLQHSEEGQSLLEFLLLLPMLFGITLILIRVNTAIQISINNQKYARAHAHFLTFNSAVFPQIRFRYDSNGFVNLGFNQMITGVSSETGSEEESFSPKATEQNITRKPVRGEDAPQQEPSERAKVRIRNTVSICTQPNVINSGGNPAPILPLDFPSLKPAGPYNMPENAKFEYCRSPLNE